MNSAPIARPPWVALGAPSNLGLRATGPGLEPGTRLAPTALRELGILAAANAADLGDVTAPPYDSRQVHGLRLNQSSIVQYSQTLARAVSDALTGEARVLVMGGDCSVLIGALAGLQSLAQQATLVHLDGHTDFRHEANHVAPGAVAGEDLAIAVGLGPQALTGVGTRFPLVSAGDVAHVGARADDEHIREARQTIGLVIAADEVTLSPMDVERRLRRFLEDRRGRPLWIHMDVDVLDPSVMPAVDAPSPGGLSPRHLVGILRLLVNMVECRGLTISVYDPARDVGREAGRLLVTIVADALAA